MEDAEDDLGGLIGVDVGGYVVDGQIGKGGMGVVYSATHPMIGKRAAIKVLRHNLSKNPATVERFVQEARSVNAIGHPGIVDIFALGALPDGRSYMVMDLLDGEPLRKRVKRGAVPVDDVIQIVDEIASALAAAHEKGFAHRDLKPDNVFLVAHPSRRIEVKLLDFGLAKLLPTSGLSERMYRTATGAQLGTPDYMSPEQLRGTGVDHRTDIYALGVMTFEMLAHGRPHRYSDGSWELGGSTFQQVLRSEQSVPDELGALVEQMLALSPDERPTLFAIRAVLKRVRTQLAPPRMTTPIPTAAPSSPALRPITAQTSETKLGVAPPRPAPSRQHPVVAARPRLARIWVIVGVAIVVVAVGVAVALFAT